MNITNVTPFTYLSKPYFAPGGAEHGNPVELPPRGQAPISCPPEIVSQGIDTLYVSFQADIPQSLLERLRVKKEEVQSTSDDCLFLPFGVTDIFAFNLQRTGKKLFPYVLKTGDFSLCLSNRKAESSIPNLQITVGSISCNNGLNKLIASFRKWCRHHGIVLKTEKISRVDLYADIALPMDTLRLWNQARMVTRAEKINLYYSNRKLTGLQVGTGDIVLRIYDKIQEMTDKQADHKAEFFQAIWGNVEHVTRVEFQLRREAVKQFCPIESDLKALQAKTGNIWNYLTTEWFRQTAKAVDRLNRNQSREITSDFWQIVQCAFQAPYKEPSTRNKKQKVINIKALIEQASGIMLTVCAGLGHVHDDLFGIFATSTDLIKDRLLAVMKDPGFKHDFSSRAVTARVSF